MVSVRRDSPRHLAIAERRAALRRTQPPKPPETPETAPVDAPRLRRPPTLRDAQGARERTIAGSQQLRAALEAMIDRDTPARTRPTSRPPGEPFAPYTRGGVDALVADVDETGDLSRLDEIDNFRQTLTPELQAEYDEQLEALRNDPRIEFEYREDVEESPAMEDLALRGTLAATFGNPRLLDATLEKALGEEGRVPFIMFAGPVPISEFHPSVDPADKAAGLALPDGGIAIDTNFFRDAVGKGGNPFVHEFAHLAQRTFPENQSDAVSERFPGDFPYSASVAEAYESDEFQEFIVDRFFGGNAPEDDDGNPVVANGNRETWPTLANLFRQYPEELAENSPEIYRALSEYHGYDPLTQTSLTPVQTNGTGSVEGATDALLENFDALPTTDGRLTVGDLEAILADPDPALPSDVRAAAAFLLSSPVSRHALDVGAGRNNVDGRISRDDLVGIQEQLANGTSLYELLADTAAGRGGRDGYISQDDVDALQTDPGVPADVARRTRV